MGRYTALIFAGVLVVAFLGVLVVQTSGINNRIGKAWGIFDSVTDTAASADPKPVRFIVNRGESTREIADRLQKAGLIHSAWFFSSLAQARGSEASLQAGEYELRADMRPSEILARLQQGVTAGKQVVVPEGWQTMQIADMLEKEGISARQSFLEVVVTAPVDASFGRPPGVSLEGYLFPDTYYIPAGATASGVAMMMVQNFGKRVDQRLRQSATDRQMTVHQIITLASIVEREAVISSEQPLIASVFYNRITAGMPLQADPTVQYSLAITTGAPKTGGYWKNELTKDDLKIDSPYNTYIHKGLPPGPIASPGISAIRAAINPAPGDFLYFVAKPDGSHVFSSTFEEHLQNVQKYR